MKKRLLIIFIVLAVVVVIIVLNSTVFTVQQSEISFYSQNGNQVITPDGINSTDLIKDFKGKNIFLLDESKLMDSLHNNPAFSPYFCIGITREFPSTVVLHIAQREPVFYLFYGGVGYLIDNYGYCTGTDENPEDYVNISNFSTWVVDGITTGTNVNWNSADASKFAILCDTVNTVWRFKYNYEDVHELIASFAFDSDTLQINTVSGAVIKLQEASSDVSDKLIKALSVYYNQEIDVTSSNTLIEVDKNGKITTQNND